MPIPISYNLRNLVVRKTTTLMTAAGIAMTVAVLLAVLGLSAGLHKAFAAQGNPLHLLIMRKGGTAELTSLFTPEQFQIVKGFPGIAKGSDGEPIASIEVVTIITLVNADNPQGANITVRGVSQKGIEMRAPKILEGRWFKAGMRELVAGKSLA